MINSSIYNLFFTDKSSSKNIQKGGADIVKLFNDKKEFLVYIFANLLVQLGITYYVMEHVAGSSKLTGNKMVFLILFQIMFIFTIIFIPMPSWLKFILFCMFSYSFGYILSFIKNKIGEDVVNIALIGTIGIFGTMFSIGAFLLVSGIRLGIKTAMFLLFSLIGIIIARIVMIFGGTSSSLMKIITIFSLIVFSIYIVYDTNKILQRNYYGDFITASLDYYLDIINIFLNITDINS